MHLGACRRPSPCAASTEDGRGARPPGGPGPHTRDRGHGARRKKGTGQQQGRARRRAPRCGPDRPWSGARTDSRLGLRRKMALLVQEESQAEDEV